MDGRILPIEQACIPVTDRGFLVGDQVFDTLRTRAGLPFLLGEHMDRLRRSAEAARIPVPWSDAELSDIVDALLPERPDPSEWVLRFTLTRGDGGHGLVPPARPAPRLVVLCRPMPVSFPATVSVALDPRPLGRDPTVAARVKTSNYLGAVIALQAARGVAADELLVRGSDGGWIEATSSNLFVLTGGVALAPGEGHGALPGVTRALVLELLGDLGVPLLERSVRDDELVRADEVFITSTVKGILPVARVDGRPVGAACPGPVTRRLFTALGGAVARIRLRGASRLAEAFDR